LFYFVPLFCSSSADQCEVIYHLALIIFH
jgi:hypothetical protein